MANLNACTAPNHGCCAARPLSGRGVPIHESAMYYRRDTLAPDILCTRLVECVINEGNRIPSEEQCGPYKVDTFSTAAK